MFYAFASLDSIHSFVYPPYNKSISVCLLQQEIDGSNPAGKWIGHGDVLVRQNARLLVPG